MPKNPYEKVLEAYRKGKTKEDVLADPELAEIVKNDKKLAHDLRMYWYGIEKAKEDSATVASKLPHIAMLFRGGGDTNQATEQNKQAKPTTTPKQKGAGHKEQTKDMGAGQILEYDEQKKAEHNERKNTGNRTDRWNARTDEFHYMQDAPAKVAEMVRNLDHLSKSDYDYAKKNYPQVATDLNKWAGATDDAQAVGAIQSKAKEEKKKHLANFGKEKQKEIQEQFKSIGIPDVNVQHALADPMYLTNLREQVKEAEKRVHAEATKGGPISASGVAGLITGNALAAAGGVKGEYFAQKQAAQQQFDAIYNSLTLIEAMRLRIENPNASPEEIGAMAQRTGSSSDIRKDVKLSAGGSKKLNREAEELGLQADVMLGDPERMEAAMAQMETINDRHPDQKRSIIANKLAVEHNRDNAWWTNVYRENPTLAEADKYAEQLNSTDRAFYLKHMRPKYEKEQKEQGMIRSIPTQDLAGRFGRGMESMLNDIASGIGYVTGTMEKERAISRQDKAYKSRFDVVGDNQFIQSEFKELDKKVKKGSATPEEVLTHTDLMQYVDTRNWKQQAIGMVGDATSMMIGFGTAGRVIGAGTRAATNAALRKVGLGATSGGAAAGITVPGFGIRMGVTASERIGLVASGYLISIDQRMAEAERIFADDKKDAGWKTQLYGHSLSLLEGITELIIPDTKYLDMFNGSMRLGMKDIVNAIGKTGMSRSGFKDQFTQLIKTSLNTIANAGFNAGGEITEELIIEWSDGIMKAVMAPASFDLDQMLENSADVAVHTGVGFLPMSIYGASRNAGRTASKYMVPELAAIGRDARYTNAVIEGINKAKAEGIITEKEYAEKMATVKNLQDVNKELQDIDGSQLNLRGSKLDKWVVMAANERLMAAQLGVPGYEIPAIPQVKDEVIRKQIEKTLNESKKNRQRLVDNELLVNLEMELVEPQEVVEKVEQEREGLVEGETASQDDWSEVQQGLGAETKTRIVSLPINDLTTDTKSFQGRSAEYSRDTAASVVGEFDSTVWNPIVFWTNEKGEKVILAGHSREKGLIILTKLANGEQLSDDEQSVVRMARENTGLTENEMVESAKANGFVPGMVPEAKEHIGDFKSAKDVALKSNSRGTVQTPWENARIIAKKREEGVSPAQMKKDLRQVSNRGEMAYTEALSYLNPGGKAAAILTEQDKDPEKASESVRQTVRRAALTAGKMRKAYPVLQSIHEDEIFDAIMDGSVTMDEVAERVDMAVNNPEEPFDADKVMNIKQKKFLSAAAQAWYNKLKELEAEKGRLKKLLQKDSGSGRTGIETEFFEQQQANGKTATEALDDLNSDRGKEIVKQRTVDTKAGLARKEDEILLHEKGKEQLSKARQGSLFMAAPPSPPAGGEKAANTAKAVRLNPDKKKTFFGQDIDQAGPGRFMNIIDSIELLFKNVKGFGGVLLLPEDSFADQVDAKAMGDEKKMYRNMDGNVYGFESDGKIFLNDKFINANTPVHEASHLFAKWLAANNPRLHAAMLRKAGKSYWAEMVKNNPNYQGKSAEVIADEALAWAVGAMGNRMSRTFKDDLVMMWQNVKDAILGVTIRNTDELAMYVNGFKIERKTGMGARRQARAYRFDIERMEPFDIAAMSFDEVAAMVAARVLKGSPLEIAAARPAAPQPPGGATTTNGITVMLPDNPDLERMPFVTVVGDVDMDSKDADGNISIILPRPKGEELPTISLMAGGRPKNPINTNVSQFEQAKQLHELAQQIEPLVSDLLNGIDKKFNTESKTSYKLLERIVEKSNRPSIKAQDPDFDVQYIVDSFRFKTVINTINDIGGAFEELNKAGLNVIKFDFEKLFKPKEWGWRIVAFDLQMPNGLLVEYYLPIKELETAKEIGHEIFEKWRNKDFNKLTPRERYALKVDRIASNELYQNAFNDYLNRVGQTETEANASFMNLVANASSVTRSKSFINSSADGIFDESQTPSFPLSAEKKSSRVPPSTKTRPVDGSIEAVKGNFSIESNLQNPDETANFMAGKNQLSLLFPQIDNTNTRFDETKTETDTYSEPPVQYIKSSTGESTPFKIYSPERSPAGADMADDRRPSNLLVGENEYDPEDQFAYIERQWTENKSFSFTGKTKIQSHSDVAWLFSSLEDEAIEQVFAVYIKEDGSYVVQHISSGTYDQAVADGKLIVGNAIAVGAKSVIIVHNHPSGNLYASGADKTLWLKLRLLLKPANIEMLDGIIINIRTGRYGYFNDYDADQNYKSDTGKGKTNIPVYSFSKQFFVKNYNPIKAKSSHAFAKLINTYRFGLNDRVELLVSNNAMYVTARILLDLNKPLYDQVNTLVSQYGGVRATLVGNVPYSKISEDLSLLIRGARAKDLNIGMNEFVKVTYTIDDYILVKSQNGVTLSGEKEWVSYADEGLMMREPGGNFMAGKPKINTAQFSLFDNLFNSNDATTNQPGNSKTAAPPKDIRPDGAGQQDRSEKRQPTESRDGTGRRPDTEPDTGKQTKNLQGAFDFEGSQVGTKGNNEQVQRGPAGPDAGGAKGVRSKRTNLDGSTPTLWDQVEKPPTAIVRHDFSFKPEYAGEATFNKRQRFDDNIAALKLLRKLETEKRQATPAEQETLSKYVGWGGLKQIILDPENDRKWVVESDLQFRDKVRETYKAIAALDPGGKQGFLKAAISSINNAHYTSIPVIRGIYGALGKAGFNSGRILEPSAGIGNFVAAMPGGMRSGSKISAIELDPITGRILQQLQQTVDVHITGFQNAKIPLGAYDLAISNVPFGQIPIVDPIFKGKKDKRYNEAASSVHNYFFVKGIDAVRPGGIVAFITSRYTMDSTQNKGVRELLSDQAEFLGAIRLPGTAFKDNAGTEVVTDVIFLRKFEEGETVKPNPGFLNAGSTAITYEGKQHEVMYSTYFQQRPEQMLGTIEIGGLYSENEFFLAGSRTANLEKQITEAGARIFPSPIYRQAQLKKNADIEKSAGDYWADAKDFERVGNLVVMNNGSVGRVLPEYYIDAELDAKANALGIDPDRIRESRTTTWELEALEKAGLSYKMWQRYSVIVFDRLGKERKDIFIRVIKLRKAANHLLNAELAGLPDETLNPLRSRLNAEYQSFVAKHGRLNDDKNFRALTDQATKDSDAFTVLSLEKKKDGKWIPSDILSKRALKPFKKVTRAETLSDGILASYQEFGKIDMDYIADLMGREVADLLKEQRESGKPLVFETPEGGVVERDEYLSGNVRKKLLEADEAAKHDIKYQVNVDELEKVQPKDVIGAEIHMPFGGSWVPADVFADFIKDIAGVNANLKYDKTRSSWKVHISGTTPQSQALQTARKGFDYVLTHAMNGTTPKITYTIGYGDNQQVLFDEVDTARAKDNIKRINASFDAWKWKDSTRRSRLQRLYNDTYNNKVLRSFDGEHLHLPGLMYFELRPHQKDAVWRVLQTGGGILDHAVGSGKTLIMGALAMEGRRLNIFKKPLFLGLKAQIMQGYAEFKQAYPLANILYPTAKDFSKDNRKRLLQQIATNDWDIIMLTHEQFNMLRQDEDIKASLYDEILAELKQQADEETDKLKLKTLNNRIDKYEQKIAELADQKKDADVRGFHELGIDFVMVDESQEFKNLEFSTKHGDVRGLGNAQGSKRAFNMLVAARTMQKYHGADKGMLFASGTPISNSISEMYTLFRYLRPSLLKEQGILSLDDWLSLFAEHDTDLEYYMGKFKDVTRLRRFVNLPELITQYRDMADVRNKYNMVIPGKPDGEHILMKVSPTDGQLEIMEQLQDFIETKGNEYASELGLTNGYDDQKGVNPAYAAMASTFARKLSMDPRLINRSFPAGSKLQAAADNIARIYHETAENSTVQLVFSDIGTPKGSSPVGSLYNHMEQLGVLNQAEMDEVFGAEFENTTTKPSMSDIRTRLQRVMELDNDEINALVEESSSADTFDVYTETKRLLINQGVKDEEIAFIHDHEGDKKRKALYALVREGKIRVLFGSTKKLGVGVNVQTKAVAGHQLDIQWKPADVEQRNGRVERQQNEVAKLYGDKVQLYYYATERLMDASMYELVQSKANFIQQIKLGGVNARSTEDITSELDMGEMAAELSGDPLFKQISVVRKKTRELELSHTSWQNEQWRLTDSIENAERVIRVSEEKLPKLKDALARFEALPKKEKKVKDKGEGEQVEIESEDALPIQFTATLGGETFDKPGKAGAKLVGVMTTAIMNKPVNEPFEIGTIYEHFTIVGTIKGGTGSQRYMSLEVIDSKTGIVLSRAESVSGSDVSAGTQLNHVAHSLPGEIGRYEEIIERNKKHLAEYKEQVNPVFEKEAELKALHEELAEKEVLVRERLEARQAERSARRSGARGGQAAQAAAAPAEESEPNFMAGPNGKRSNLTPAQYAQVRTSEFKAWFGDWENDPKNASKVVDENGEPMVVYHGTNKQFSKFDQNKKGRNTDWENTHLGFFFIQNPDLATMFGEKNVKAKHTLEGAINQLFFPVTFSQTAPVKKPESKPRKGASVMPVFLNIRKPIDIRTQAIFNNKEQAPYIAEIAFRQEGLSPSKALKLINDEIGLGEMQELSEILISEDAKEYYEAFGVDGMLSEFGANTIEYIAFHSNQIKSATANTGSFNAGNPDIRFMAGRAGLYAPATPEQKETRRQLDAAMDEYDAAKGAYERKRKDLMKSYKEGLVDMFGQTAEQRGGMQKLFDEKPQLRAAEKALQPYKARMDKAVSETSRLYGKYMGMEKDESKQMSLFMAGTLSGEEVWERAKQAGSEHNEGLDEHEEKIKSNRYIVKKIKISEILKADPDVKHFVENEIDPRVSGSDEFTKTREIKQPIIMGELERGGPLIKNGVIDGFHRIAQAITNGQTTIDAYVPLTSKLDKESDDIRFMIGGEKGAARMQNAERILDNLKKAKQMATDYNSIASSIFEDMPEDARSDARMVNRGDDTDGQAMQRIQANPAAKIVWADYIRAREHAAEWASLDAKEQNKRILLATGWQQGKDGKWKYEMADGKLIQPEFIEEIRKYAKFNAKAVESVNYQKNADGTYNLYLIGEGAKSTKDILNVNKKNLDEIKDDFGIALHDAIAANEGELKSDYNYLVPFEQISANDGVPTTILNKFIPINVSNGTLLKNVFNQPDLFKAYPQLLKAQMFFFEGDVREKGRYFKWGDVHNIGVNAISSGDRMLSTILHEVQHAIQDIEGFAKGGSPQMFDAQKIKQEIYSLLEEKIDALRKQPESLKRDVFIKKYRDDQAAIISQDDDFIRSKRYRELAGEVEARNVQTRMGYDDFERSTTLFEETEDVNRADQIVLIDAMGMGASFMAGEADPMANVYRRVYAAQKAGKPDAQIKQEMVDQGIEPLIADNIISRARINKGRMDGTRSNKGTPTPLTRSSKVPDNEPGMMDKIGGWLMEMFTSSQGQEKWFRELSDYARGESLWILRKAERYMDKVLKPAFEKMSVVQKKGFMEMITDKDAASANVMALTPEQKRVAQQYRSHIDNLTTEFIVNGWVTPNQAQVLLSNVGSYLNRSYRIFNEKDWTKNIPEKAKVDALNYLKEQIYNHASPGNPGYQNDREAERLAILELGRILEEAAGDKFGFNSLAEGARDNGILKQRKDVPAELRALYGEYTDPAELFMMTIARMAALRTQAKYLNDVFAMGIGKIFWNRNDPNADPNATVEIAGEGSNTWSPLNGLYARPEVARYITEGQNRIPEMAKHYLKFGALVKMGKTVYSPITQAINMFSNSAWYLANGYWLSNPAGQAVDIARTTRLWFDNVFANSKNTDYWNQRLLQLGLFDGSVGLHDIKRMFAEGDADAIMMRAQHNIAKGFIDKIKATVADNAIIRSYGMSDAASKFIGWRKESEALAWGRLNKSYDDLTADERDTIEKEAAERVKNTQPTGPRAYKGALWLSKNAYVFGNFITYQAEALRCARNVFAYAWEDMGSDNARMKVLGARRMAGIMTYLGLRGVILNYLAQAGGMAMSGFYSMFNDDDDEKKKKKLEAINALGRSYMRVNDKYMVKNEDGSWMVYNLNALEPFNGVFKIGNAITNGNEVTPDAGLKAAVTELVWPYMEPDMIVNSLVRTLIKDEDAMGREVYGAGAKAATIAQDLGPSAIPFVQRSFRKPDGRQAEWGEILTEMGKLDVEFDPRQLIGFRPYRVDPVRNFKTFVRDQLDEAKRTNDTRWQMEYKYKMGDITDAEYDKAIEDDEMAQEALGQKIYEMKQHAIVLGADEGDLNKIVKSAMEIKTFKKPTRREAMQ